MTEQPSLYIAGERDASTSWLADAIDNHRHTRPGLVSQHILERRGHWIQPEAPAEVNHLLLHWLTARSAATASA